MILAGFLLLVFIPEDAGGHFPKRQQAVWCYMPADSILHSQQCENRKPNSFNVHYTILITVGQK
jgi:hypothetical protein